MLMNTECFLKHFNPNTNHALNHLKTSRRWEENKFSIKSASEKLRQETKTNKQPCCVNPLPPTQMEQTIF